MIAYNKYSPAAVGDIVRLRRRLDQANVPPRRTDHNLIIGTWNIRALSNLYLKWDENPGSPKRNLRAMAIIAEIIRRFDVVAIQEVKRSTQALRVLLDDFLGPNWGVILSDVSAGAEGNAERLTFLYDKRRVIPSGLAGEIVLPPVEVTDAQGRKTMQPATQFDRTPYIVGFQAASERFSLLTVHIRYGKVEADRVEEVRNLARYVAGELRSRATEEGAEETNLILLGDFNISQRTESNILFQELLNVGLWVPEAIRGVKSTYGTTPKHYDQIAWFRDDLRLLGGSTAGAIDFAGAVFKEMSLENMSFRLTDHFPLWVEFFTDRSAEAMASVLGIDPAMPDPFAGVPD
ncbi:MAG: endonuclease/exonuclease/phosphatase family protein [Anaerolineae bacterium]